MRDPPTKESEEILHRQFMDILTLSRKALLLEKINVPAVMGAIIGSLNGMAAKSQLHRASAFCSQ